MAFINASAVQSSTLTARVGVYAVANFLIHAQPSLILERFADTQAVPKNKSLVIRWRRPVPYTVSTTALVEGVTPAPTGLSFVDVQGGLVQLGGWVEISDVIVDTHEDENLKVMTMLAGEQAAQTKERVLWNMMVAGTNVIYTGTATTRATVVATLAIRDIRLVQRALKVALAKTLTKMVDASPKIATQPIAPGFIAIGHTNLEFDLRGLTGFVPREQYSNTTVMLNDAEIGKIEDVRFILAPHYTNFLGAGAGDTPPGVLKTGANADVHPLVFFGANAFAATPLKGMESAQIAVRNPEMGSSSTDPLGQRGYVAWKMWYSATRLNEAWIVRIEAAASSL